MAQDVNVSFEHMESVAKQLTSGQSQIEEQLLALKKQVDTLVAEGFVTDQSSKAFQSSYEEFNVGITKTVAGIEGLSGFLTKAVGTFRDSDTGLASGLKG
ncbi:MAG: WXG100 family type VII secretion target [Pseudolysinimonas sp.]